eukprot:TRINITY_DN10839_c0_g1_i1.p1 TRINITY_DN10839_c0_g1~~TRINITY_DN10839_c0_g1_i1.p1  ORF type:complete len:297 (+),score=59.95 TRINITY_DN10839_c0_g1_i1:93-983(+)
MLDARHFGRFLPLPSELERGVSGLRQKVLLETLQKFEENSTTKYHDLAKENLKRWKEAAKTTGSPDSHKAGCTVRVVPGDWGEETYAVTKEFGEVFAALNMANAYAPGGGYVEGMPAQEENMFRRTDCHFSIDAKDLDPHTRMYLDEETDLYNAVHGRVFLDVTNPRVCIRGGEDRSSPDLGYRWLTGEEVFPFFELRAAAVDLRGSGGMYFPEEEMRKRIVAQLETLIENKVRHVVLSAFGCGAFLNPADEVAKIYHAELSTRLEHFDCVIFAIFHAGYGPDNFAPFKEHLSSLL